MHVKTTGFVRGSGLACVKEGSKMTPGLGPEQLKSGITEKEKIERMYEQGKIRISIWHM